MGLRSTNSFDIARLWCYTKPWFDLPGWFFANYESRVRASLQNANNEYTSFASSAFPGLHAQKQAIEYGVKVTGCTVHFVDEGLDSGPIIAQKVVPVFGSDTEEILSSRILKQEHKLYIKSINLFAEGKISFKGRSVLIRS
jgi:formyltetrahydrofolate hydrolase